MRRKTRKLVLSSVLLALGIVLPFFTGQIKEIGDTLLPMHMPAMICGFTCGPIFGGVTGLLIPLIRSFTFGMPPLYPNAIWMSLELCAYGLTTGLFYLRKKKRSTLYLYISLISAMICGRVVWGVAKVILLGLKNKPFTFQMFIASGFVDALPGIIIQLILIPIILRLIEKPRVSEREF